MLRSQESSSALDSQSSSPCHSFLSSASSLTYPSWPLAEPSHSEFTRPSCRLFKRHPKDILSSELIVVFTQLQLTKLPFNQRILGHRFDIVARKNSTSCRCRCNSYQRICCRVASSLPRRGSRWLTQVCIVVVAVDLHWGHLQRNDRSYSWCVSCFNRRAVLFTSHCSLIFYRRFYSLRRYVRPPKSLRDQQAKHRSILRFSEK